MALLLLIFPKNHVKWKPQQFSLEIGNIPASIGDISEGVMIGLWFRAEALLEIERRQSSTPMILRYWNE